jgi:hypothetical protein
MGFGVLPPEAVSGWTLKSPAQLTDCPTLIRMQRSGEVPTERSHVSVRASPAAVWSAKFLHELTTAGPASTAASVPELPELLELDELDELLVDASAGTSPDDDAPPVELLEHATSAMRARPETATAETMCVRSMCVS